MFFTKSLFVEFSSCPQWAWRHVNNQAIYQKINDYYYGSMDGFAIGKAVEDVAKKIWLDSTIVSVDKTSFVSGKRHESYHQQTTTLLDGWTPVIYQGGFLCDNLFVIHDFLVLNKEGRYDLYEVKSKNSIRNNGSESRLYDDIRADVSVQSYVLHEVLGERFSGNCYVVYLNKDYVCTNGDFDPSVLRIEFVSADLFDGTVVVDRLFSMKRDLFFSKEDFDALYPWKGQDYMLYYGEPPPKGSIWSIPSNVEERVGWAQSGKRFLTDLSDEDLRSYTDRVWDEDRGCRYVQLYRSGEEFVERDRLAQLLGSLQFPLYFYDYETISWPVPFLVGTKPRQQVVVQYSVHILHEDGRLVHRQWLIDAQASDNATLVLCLLEDLDYGRWWSYIVWYQNFENQRNEELSLLYPDTAAYFDAIRARTFDLMEVFKSFAYFHRGFNGSCSLKNVLPVMTDMSYADLAVGHGGVASDLLLKRLRGEVSEWDIHQIEHDLLEYCKQDTLAMVRIYQSLLEKLVV